MPFRDPALKRQRSGTPSGASPIRPNRFPVEGERRFIALYDYPAPEVEKLWRAFLQRIDSPSHYDAPEYFLEPYWAGKTPFSVLALDQEQIVGVVCGLHLKDGIECGLPSRPQIRVDDKGDTDLSSGILAEGLLQEAGRSKLITVFAWNWVPLAGLERRGFLRRELEGDVVIDLGKGIAEVYKQFHENRKRNIRIALKNGIEVSEALTQEDLAEYWKVYSTWRQTSRKKIVHDQSFSNLEKVHGMRKNHRRFLARYRGKVIAATGLRFLQGGLVEYANNCSLDEFMQLRPNDLLIWRTIEWACQQGFTKYSMGAAHPFVRKSGGVLVPISRYRLDRTFLHRHDLKENIRSQARSLLNRVPKGIGQSIRKLLGKA